MPTFDALDLRINDSRAWNRVVHVNAREYDTQFFYELMQ